MLFSHEPETMSLVSLTKNIFFKWLIGFLSFDGTEFVPETLSQFPHEKTFSLGSYLNSPFVTGHFSSTNGLKTEVYEVGRQKKREWRQKADYPFADNGDRWCIEWNK